MYYSLALGQRIDPTRTSYPESLQLHLSEQLVELVVYLGEPSAEEIADVQTGALGLALVDAAPHCLFLGVRLGTQPWTDAIFEAHRTRHDLTGFIEQAGDSLALRVLLVDAQNGILVAWRFGELPVDFTDAIRAAVAAQLAATYDPDATSALIDGTYQQFPTSEALVRQFASATCTIAG